MYPANWMNFLILYHIWEAIINNHEVLSTNCFRMHKMNVDNGLQL